MFTPLKSLHSSRCIERTVSFVAALVIAEMFYKFHSFLLETGAFLVTWFVLGAIVHTVAGWVLPKEPTSRGE